MVVLGGGTNVVVSDAGLDALVVAVQLRGLDIVDEGDTVVVTAAAGELWDAVVAAAVARGGPGSSACRASLAWPVARRFRTWARMGRMSRVSSSRSRCSIP
jgi:hypothetical protein